MQMQRGGGATTTAATMAVMKLIRGFSSSVANNSKIPKLRNIPWKYKPMAVKEARQALTDYLHSTRSLPYAYAENISNHSSLTLSAIISKLTFSPSSFSDSFRRYLRYHPINEFEFFLESIGIDYHRLPSLLPHDKFFFSQHRTPLHVAFHLSAFGFPWNRLGLLYTRCASIFDSAPEEVDSRLELFKSYGFANTPLAGICLAFPFLLGPPDPDGDVPGLFSDLKTLFLDFDLAASVPGNVDAWYQFCRKVRVFYDLGCRKGTLGELLGRSKHVFVDYSEDSLLKKVDYFCRFCVGKEEVALLLLQKPEILSFDMETRVFSVGGLLEHFGLNAEELTSVSQKYAHVMGRNKMANLPNVMRAMNLDEWFFQRLKDGDPQLLDTCAVEEDLDTKFRESLDKIRASRTPVHTMNKLNFMLGVGFGENALTIKVLANLHGTGSQLQERFDFLNRAGIGFSNLCMMVRTMPKILNQKPEILEEKLTYLREEMNTSLEYLDTFPAFLNFNLENRIKPRYRFHAWLTENGYCSTKYSIASIIATSEKSFQARLRKIHPDAPKLWSKFCSAPAE
ncbi:hypothetical protein Tsubulata_008497 [Turnera subulata]|uniref:Uncharacterized protein n=1 Tax=Turnera subulata TaxID=218843 RepID=A0A9Q0G532_9ROSI|nr:hypothetical protein Tsubulata_008497 [Turnera subulata]